MAQLTGKQLRQLLELPNPNQFWDTFNEIEAYGPTADAWGGRKRWYQMARLSIVDPDAANPYGLPTLRHDGSLGNLAGKVYYFDELGVEDGDQVAIKMHGVAASGTHRIWVRQVTSYTALTFHATPGISSSSYSFSGTAQTMELTLTAEVASGAVGFVVASYDNAGSGHTFDIYAIWGSVLGSAKPAVSVDRLPALWAELIAARSGQASLLAGIQYQADDRSPYPEFFGRRFMRDWDGSIAKIQQSAGEVCVIAFVGDSWVNEGTMYRGVRDYFQGLYGDAGVGFLSLGTPNEISGLSITTVGTWTTSDESSGSRGVDISHVESSDTATPAKKSFTYAAQEFVIHYLASSSLGSFRYRVDGGGWTTVNCNNGGAEALGTETISSLADSNHTLEIEIVSGSIKITGVDIRKTPSDGVRVHALGNGGLDTAEIVAVDATIWQDGLAALVPNVVIVFIGTNDHNGDMVPATFQSNLTTIISRIRAAVPLADVLLISPADNDLSATYELSEYDGGMRTVAIAQSVGHISGLKIIDDYSDGNSRGLYLNTSHLNSYGYTVLVNAIIRFLHARP